MNLLNVDTIVRLRELHGWDQKDLAKAANVTKSVISRLERNLQSDYRLSVIIGIANALGVAIDDILAQPHAGQLAELQPELKSAVSELSDQPEDIQRQAAGIIKGYVSTLD